MFFPFDNLFEETYLLFVRFQTGLYPDLKLELELAKNFLNLQHYQSIILTKNKELLDENSHLLTNVWVEFFFILYIA